MMLYGGLDTSCYATSLAFLDKDKELVWENRKQLKVPSGARGLRQSEMVFQHINHLPFLWQEAKKELGSIPLAGLAYSSRPRPQKNSYMPVFKVAEAFGKSIALAAGCEMLSSTHQEGHIAAGCWSSGIKSRHFLAVHLSGGTSEILLVEDKIGSFEIEKVGGTTDLNAGQFVDRIGMAMNLPFPSGPFMEKKALELKGEAAKVPVSLNGSWFSFSGPATFAERFIAHGGELPEIARGVELCIGKTLAGAINNVINNVPVYDLLVVGGVAANTTIRTIIVDTIKNMKVFFPETTYAGDNAVGLAYLGYLFKGSGK